MAYPNFTDAEIALFIMQQEESFPEPTEAEIDYILKQQYAHEDEMDALEKYYAKIDFSVSKKKPRTTHCWGCTERNLNSEVHNICPTCGWIICPTCGRCSKIKCHK
jgi:hypothetical protein